MNEKLLNLHAREILDSRGLPTVEVRATLANGVAASASVPSGRSTGQYEAWELRDNDAARYNGKGVLTACGNVNDTILPALKGMPVGDQRAIDARLNELDGTANKGKLGANAILGVSLACARAASLAAGQPLYRYLHEAYAIEGEVALPTPALNVINGGRHADNGIDFQEYMVVPQQKRFRDQLQCAAEVVMSLGNLLRSQSLSSLVGDEGGFAPALSSNRAPLQAIAEAVGRTRYALGADVRLSLDVAASEFFLPEDGRYFLRLEQKRFTTEEMVDFLGDLSEAYPFVSIEDGLAEGDWAGWKLLTETLGKQVRIIGDDLFCTNVGRIERGIAEHAGNGVLIKPNQIGTVTETMEAIALARKHAMTVFVSHRSGETSDDFIADLAVAVHAEYLKAGSVVRSERLAKYNRLLAIEEELS